MLRKFFHVAAVTTTLVPPADAFAGIRATVSPFITKDFVNLRKGPGANWPSLAVIPPSTAVTVDYCSTTWSIGCEVTYEAQTGFVHSSLLQTLAPRRAGKCPDSAPAVGVGGLHVALVLLAKFENARIIKSETANPSSIRLSRDEELKGECRFKDERTTELIRPGKWQHREG
jgi:uncharacterized protein YraI